MLALALSLALAPPESAPEVQRPEVQRPTKPAAPKRVAVEARRVEPAPAPAPAAAAAPVSTPPVPAAPSPAGLPSAGFSPVGAPTTDAPTILAPSSSGTVGFAAGGVITATGIGVRMVGLSFATRNLDFPGAAFADLWSFGALGTLAVGGGLGFAAIGARHRGQWSAHQDIVLRGTGPRFDTRKRQVIGWSVMGGGILLWIGSRLAIASALPRADDAGRLIVASELTYFAALGGTATGLFMAMHANGYADWVRRVEILESLSIAPGPRGVVVSGRF